MIFLLRKMRGNWLKVQGQAAWECSHVLNADVVSRSVVGWQVGWQLSRAGVSQTLRRRTRIPTSLRAALLIIIELRNGLSLPGADATAYLLSRTYTSCAS